MSGRRIRVLIAASDDVAEGIEGPGEVEALADLGVRYGQGYFFARPAPLPLLVGATGADRDGAA